MKVEVRAFELHLIPRPLRTGQTCGWVFPYGGRNGLNKEQASRLSDLMAQELVDRGILFRREERRLKSVERGPEEQTATVWTEQYLQALQQKMRDNVDRYIRTGV